MPASLRPTPAAIIARHPMRSTGWHASVKRTPLSRSLRHSMTKTPTPIARCRRWSSPVDPSSAWTAKANKRVQFGYGLNYLIDLGPHAVIVDVEGTPARTYDEVAATKTMINRTEETFGLKLKRLAADTAYGTGKLLAWLLEKDITPHIPVWERYERTDGMFSRLDFTYDAERDVYICPNGRFLRTTGTVHDGRARNYLSQSGECRVCGL